MTQSTLAFTAATAITGHVAVIDGQPTTTQDIAEVYGKKHDNVLRVVRQRMAEVPSDWCLLNFEETETERASPLNGAPIKSPVIRMTKKGFHFVVGKFTGAKAVQHQIAFADEFERMEAELQKPIHDTDRIKQAFALASEVAQQAAITVFNAVVDDNEVHKHDRWMFHMDWHARNGEPQPWAQPIKRNAMVVSMAELSGRLLEKGSMLPTNQELADLAAACNQRLAQRMQHEASKSRSFVS